MREAEELAKVFAEIDVMLSWDGGRGFDNFVPERANRVRGQS